MPRHATRWVVARHATRWVNAHYASRSANARHATRCAKAHYASRSVKAQTTGCPPLPRAFSPLPCRDAAVQNLAPPYPPRLASR